MRLARPLVWTLVGLVLAVALGVWLLPGWLGGDRAREKIEAALSDALGRDVTVDELVVERGAPHAELRGVTVSSGAAFDDLGPLLRARSLTFDVGVDALVEGRIVGTVVARGVDLHVVRRDGTTNLHGLGQRHAGEKKRATQLQLALEIDGSTVVLDDLDRDESLTLSGVGVRAVLAHGDEAPGAGITVTVASMDVHEIPVHDVTIGGSVRDGAFVVQRLKADVAEAGRVEGDGRYDPREASWSLAVKVSDLALDGPAVAAISRMYPPLALASADGEVTGTVSTDVELAGQGLSWATAAPTAHGRGTVAFADVTIPEQALLAQLATLAGHEPGPLSVPSASATFELADGWITLGPVASSGNALDPHVRGRVALDGRLELTADLMPLVEVFGGGIYAEASRVTTSLPVRIEGTIEAPQLRPPAAKDVARGLLGGAIRRALTDPPADD